MPSPKIAGIKYKLWFINHNGGYSQNSNIS
uniref:Uncharacterized protein n=1 Tax=Arundo donax TaxID=35708 RepID=A0A0A8Y254_ARUDO